MRAWAWAERVYGIPPEQVVGTTFAEREWAYDRQSHIGKVDKALDEAMARRWTVVDMKRDWKTIFPVR